MAGRQLPSPTEFSFSSTRSSGKRPGSGRAEKPRRPPSSRRKSPKNICRTGRFRLRKIFAGRNVFASEKYLPDGRFSSPKNIFRKRKCKRNIFALRPVSKNNVNFPSSLLQNSFGRQKFSGEICTPPERSPPDRFALWRSTCRRTDLRTAGALAAGEICALPEHLPPSRGGAWRSASFSVGLFPVFSFFQRTIFSVNFCSWAFFWAASYEMSTDV